MSGPEEATAEMRLMARTMRDMYVALIAEDFTVSEALQIIGAMLAAAAKGGTTG